MSNAITLTTLVGRVSKRQAEVRELIRYERLCSQQSGTDVRKLRDSGIKTRQEVGDRLDRETRVLMITMCRLSTEFLNDDFTQEILDGSVPSFIQANVGEIQQKLSPRDIRSIGIYFLLTSRILQENLLSGCIQSRVSALPHNLSPLSEYDLNKLTTSARLAYVAQFLFEIAEEKAVT